MHVSGAGEMEDLLATKISKGEKCFLNVQGTSQRPWPPPERPKNPSVCASWRKQGCSCDMALHGNASIFSLVAMEKAGTMSNSGICAALESGWAQ